MRPAKDTQSVTKSKSKSVRSLKTPSTPNNITSYYQPIRSNKYLVPQIIHRDQIRLCNCKNVDGTIGCSDRRCVNVRNHRECPANCTLGELCANRNFTNLNQPKCIRFRTRDRGYGVKAAQFIPKGSLIREYVGEVIDEKEKEKRYDEYVEIGYPPDYYMEVDEDRIIDATFKGNLSRFINHSCESNAKSQAWLVDGVRRIGIFSIRDINPGEEITYDYGTMYYDRECRCGAPSCSGWINQRYRKR